MSRDIPLTLIDTDPNQPRQHFDPTTLDELAQSMAVHGLAVPILVRPVGERFMLAHGERRWRAAQSLGWQTITAEVRDIPGEDARWLSLIENIQRADLSPIEEAHAYRAYLDTGMTQEELGRRIGKSRTHIATKLRFLKLPDYVQHALMRGVITEGHVKQLLRLDDPDAMSALCFDIVLDTISVRDVSSIVDNHLAFGRKVTLILQQLYEMGKILHHATKKYPLSGSAWERFCRECEWKITPSIGDALIAFVDNPPQQLDDIPDDVFDWFIEDLHRKVGPFPKIRIPDTFRGYQFCKYNDIDYKNIAV